MKPKCFSSESLNTNVADLVIESPCLATLFENNKVEYCCEGNIPLRHSLQKLKISEIEFLNKMNLTLGVHSSTYDYPDIKNPIEVIDFIMEIYHKPLPKMLDELGRLVNKAAAHHGPNKPYTIELKKQFDALAEDLTAHLWKEENVLFPMIKELYNAKIAKKPKPYFHCGSVNNPIGQMEYEHEAVGAILRNMEALIATENIPETGCTTLKTMKKVFEHLKVEIHKHIHMENYILHPLSRELEN